MYDYNTKVVIRLLALGKKVYLVVVFVGMMKIMIKIMIKMT